MTTMLNSKVRRILAGLAGLFLILALTPVHGISQGNGITTRRIWKGDPAQFCCGNTLVSLDGRYVPGWSHSTGDLAYLDMMEDRWVSVTDKGTWDENDSFSLNGMFSPDGQWLAHTWSNADRQARTTVAELRLDRVDGSDHRVILSGPAASPLDWTPDGTMVLATVRRIVDGDGEMYLNTKGRPGFDQLVLIPVDGGEPRVLKEFSLETTDGRMALTPSIVGLKAAMVSPDGRWVAYQINEEGTTRPDIYIISTDGEAERPLVTGNGNDILLGWIPDGSGILFHSGREMRQGIWRLNIRDGVPVGEPEHVREDVFGMEPLGVGPKGFYYLVHAEHPQVHTAEIDFVKGEMVSAPAPIRNPGSGNTSLSPAWSPDGRQLAYMVRDQGITELFIQSLETGEVMTFPLPVRGVEKVAWGSDPRSLVLNATLPDRTHGLFRFDLQTSELSLELSGSEDGVWNLEDTFKRDGRSFVREVEEPGGRGRIEVLDLETDETRTILRSDTGFPWVWVTSFPGANQYAVWIAGNHPDGNGAQGRLLVVNADGTGERTLWEGRTESMFTEHMAVTSDGKYILMGKDGGNWIVDVVSGERRILKTASGEEFRGVLRYLVMQPNGSRVAFGGGASVAEIWLMEGIW
jgi:dipeptidyl aminopeptidase/acylaminoacyl peptidase